MNGQGAAPYGMPPQDMYGQGRGQGPDQLSPEDFYIRHLLSQPQQQGLLGNGMNLLALALLQHGRGAPNAMNAGAASQQSV